MGRTSYRGFPVLVALIIVGFVSGCVSTQERYEKAVDLESEGQYADAANYYIKVLEQEPAYEEARTRLQQVGHAAIDRYLSDAEHAERLHNYHEAYQSLSDLDELRDRSERVGVSLPVPDDYESYREHLTTRAIQDLLDKAELAERAQKWSDAIQAYDRAIKRYLMSPEQEVQITSSKADVFIRWGDHEMSRERYRAAYERAQRVLELEGIHAGLYQNAQDLQEEALQAGTRFVAFFPLRATPELVRKVPRGFLEFANEKLEDEYWSEPPLFVSSTDPRQVRRELQRFRSDRNRISLNEASEIGRDLKADFVVLTEMRRYDEQKTQLRSERRPARRRGMSTPDTSYVVEQYMLSISAEVHFQVVDPKFHTIIHQESVQASYSDRVEEASYAGNYRDLALSGSERRLFEDSEDQVDVRELEDRVIHRLSEELARRAYENLLSRIR